MNNSIMSKTEDLLGSVLSDTRLGVDPKMKRILQVTNVVGFVGNMLVNYLDSDKSGEMQ